MKTLGRILIILAVFALVMGITYVVVNARSSSAPGGTNRFEPGNGRFAAPDGASPGFQNDGQLPFPREGREFHGERGGAGWLFGSLKNIAIIGILVALVVIPKSWIQKRKRTTQIATG